MHLYKYFPIKLQLKIVNGYTIKKNSIIPLYTNYFYLNLLNVQSQYLFKKKFDFLSFFNKISPDISLNII